MEFDILFDHMPEYVLIRTYGEASVHDFDDLLKTLVNSPEWIKGTRQLVDHRKLSATYLTSKDVQEIENITRKYGHQLKGGDVAFAVSDTESFGMVRMYELLGGENTHNEIRVFYSIKDAVAWLME
jgi:hypothetical protein